MRKKEIFENFDSWPPLKKLLQRHTQAILNRVFKNENILDYPKKLAELGSKKLLRMNFFGRKTVRYLAKALKTLGLINDIEEWQGFE